MSFAIGDHVRMVQTESVGTVVGEPDSEGRLPVRWVTTGVVTLWQPVFLRPAGTLSENDPDEVRYKDYVRRRPSRVRNIYTGVTMPRPGGFFFDK